MELKLSDKSLVVFIDDTGHENLVKGHPVYGLGGCAVMAPSLERIIQAPWRHVRRIVTGCMDTPLHAVKFSRGATQDQIEAVATFFQKQQFARLGAILTLDTQLDDELEIVSTLLMVLQKRIADIAKWTRFERIDIIFESSERANRLIKKAMQGINFQENGNPIPVDCYFMPKAANEPALEVADFIMHAIGRQARRNLSSKKGFNKDFQATFHSIPSNLVSYIEITKATTDKTNE